MEWYVWIVLIVSCAIIVVYIYVYGVKDWLEYRKAKKEISAFVKSYKKRCTGNNRFVVTVESLQDSFREYDSSVILNVWMDLVNERVVEQDPQDQEWCVR
jgi:hypothetical protein